MDLISAISIVILLVTLTAVLMVLSKLVGYALVVPTLALTPALKTAETVTTTTKNAMMETTLSTMDATLTAKSKTVSISPMATPLLLMM